jgi:hypothetical protein
MMSRNIFFFLSGVLLLAACETVDTDYADTFTDDEGRAGLGFPGAEDNTEEPDRAEAKAVWGSRDDPSLFDNDLEYRLTALPQSATLETPPWASSYWPVYEDSINYRWNGSSSKSPAAKYGEAFGVANIEDRVSSTHGIDARSNRTACTTTSQCDSSKGESCAKRQGEDAGYCIPTWWGICHAWAPAALLTPEPEHAVTRNGVEFKVNDIKALLTLAYNQTDVRFVSLRCNEDEDDIDYDDYDRPTGDDTECADTNPGTYHVLLANYFGLRGIGFVEDRTFDAEVWNQPIRGYRVTKMEQVSTSRANELVGVDPVVDATDSVVATTQFAGSLTANQWHHESAIDVTGADTFSVIMTGTSDADLYVRFGSRPTSSQYDCRPWLNGSDEQCSLNVPSGATRVFVSVAGYSGTSSFNANTTVTTGGTDASGGYRFNAADGLALYDVALQVDYITESSPHTDGNLANNIDQYTNTDYYTYVLEVDSDGKVVGGEWTGASKTAHPDFLWLPTARTDGQRIAGGAIQWHLVKELLDASVSPDTGGGDLTVETVDNNDTVVRDQWKHYGPFDASAGTITAEMTGTNDADLYLRMGSQPTTSSYDCRPYRNGSVETCTAEGPGMVYVSVRGYATTSNFDLTVSFYVGEGDTTAPTPDPDPTTDHLNESGSVNQGQGIAYSVPVFAGKPIVIRTVAPNDVDLYVKFGSAPTTSSYDQRGYTVSGNETIEVTPTSSGTLYLMVQGYAASSYTLTTSDN